MTVREILDRLTKEDVERAIASFETDPYERKVKDDYTLIHLNRKYPGRELIMRASNRQLEKAENEKTYTTISAKNKLIDLGYKNFANDTKMYKYYLKKASNQDVTRTTVLNSEAVGSFFGVNIPNERDSATISIKYLPDNTIDNTVKITKHQDPRIFIDRSRFDEGDILLFTNEGSEIFFLEIIKPISQLFEKYNQALRGNFLITDTLPYFDATNNINDPDPIYEITKMKYPLNQILYGPPGTGKTDATIEISLKILDKESTETDPLKKREDNRSIFSSLLSKEIFFVTMHPSNSYEEFVQGIKPKIIKDTLLFESKNGIFKQIAEMAKKIYEDEGEITNEEIDNLDILRICFFLSKFNNKEDKKANNYFGSESNAEVFNLISLKFSINPNSVKNHRDKFDFLASNERKGWQPQNGSKEKLDNTTSWPYHDIYLELKDKSFDEVKTIVSSIEKKVQQKIKQIRKNINYVLILDEINRANISKVFGELITLLEDDKRIGGSNAISVTLPSGEIFGVPPNLYIVGTMNTADKSIALVDIALRRRFQFIPMYPDANVIVKSREDDSANKAKLLEEINNRLRNKNNENGFGKGVDFQIGHAYFLKGKSIKDVLNENIIPLLTEYFRNDLEKVMAFMKDIGKEADIIHYEKTGLVEYKDL